MEEDPELHYFSPEIAEAYDKMWSNVKSHGSGAGKTIKDSYERFFSMVPKGGLILDVGCGTGFVDKYLAGRGFDVVGVDYSDAMLDIARRNVPDCEFRKMDIRKLEFEDHAFDGVLAVGGVLVHIGPEELGPLFSGFARVLKSGGAVFVATRASDQPRVAVESATEGGRIRVNYHTKGEIEVSMLGCGLSIVSYVEEPDVVGRPFRYMYVNAKKI